MGTDRAFDASYQDNGPRTTHLRDVFDAILYMATTGCQWRMLPNDFPPVSTVRGYFYAWRDDGLLDEMNRKLVEAEGRKAQPTAGIIDSLIVRFMRSTWPWSKGV